MSVPAFKRVAPFTPTDITGCQLWLDANDTTTVSLSGNTVTQINDKSGNSNNTTSSTGTVTYAATGLNGRPAFSFYATGGFRGPTSITGTTLTAFTVATLNSGVNYNGRLLGLANATQNDYQYATTCQPFFCVNGGPIIAGFRNNVYMGYATNIFDTPFIGTSQFTGSSNIISINSLPGTAAADANGSFSITKYGFGCEGLSDAGVNWYGYCSEISLYNSLLTGPQQQQVEAYLAQKWGLKSIFPSGHPALTSIIYPNPNRRSGALQKSFYTNFIPTSIAGCALWLDAADATTITGTSPISAWTDKSGLGRSVTIVSGPTYGTTTRNGLNTLSFSNNSITTSIASAVGTGDFALIAVWYQSSAGTNTVLSLGTSASSSQSLGFSGDKYNFYQFGSAYESNYSYATPAWVIQVGTRISSVKKVYINGNVGTTGTFDSFNQTVTTVTIGNGDSFPISGQVAEVLIYTGTLSSTGQQQVESYLAQKWGLTASLPSGHINATKPAGTPAIVAQLYPQIRRNMLPLSRTVATVTTFIYTTGVYQYFTVPSGITSITLLMWGAGGGGIAGYTPCTGGSGACIQGNLAVTPGETLTIVVGYGGQSSQSGTTTDAMGGGGTGYNGNRGYGGGRSAIQRVAGTDIVTVGGGGGSDMSNSRAAGAATGSGTAHQGNMGARTTGASGSHGGGGGQTSGGIGGTQSGFTGSTGTKGFGGASGRGGGGGGWWGGGGAGGNNTVSGESGSGGGGSSYTDNLTPGSITTWDGFGVTGNSARLAPNSSSPYYNNYSLGGTYNANAGNGAVIITYSVPR